MSAERPRRNYIQRKKCLRSVVNQVHNVLKFIQALQKEPTLAIESQKVALAHAQKIEAACWSPHSKLTPESYEKLILSKTTELCRVILKKAIPQMDSAKILQLKELLYQKKQNSNLASKDGSSINNDIISELSENDTNDVCTDETKSQPSQLNQPNQLNQLIDSTIKKTGNIQNQNQITFSKIVAAAAVFTKSVSIKTPVIPTFITASTNNDIHNNLENISNNYGNLALNNEHPTSERPNFCYESSFDHKFMYISDEVAAFDGGNTDSIAMTVKGPAFVQCSTESDGVLALPLF